MGVRGDPEAATDWAPGNDGKRVDVKARNAGQRAKAKFMEGMPAFKALVYGKPTAKLKKPMKAAKIRERYGKQAHMVNEDGRYTVYVGGVTGAAQARGYLKALDGGRLPVRKSHTALNTLLQSAGAILMKWALVILRDTSVANGLVWGKPWRTIEGEDYDFQFVANVHDEIQTEVKEEHAERFGEFAVWAIAEAGRKLKFRVPLSGGADVGDTWASTH